MISAKEAKEISINYNPEKEAIERLKINLTIIEDYIVKLAKKGEVELWLPTRKPAIFSNTFSEDDYNRLLSELVKLGYKWCYCGYNGCSIRIMW